LRCANVPIPGYYGLEFVVESLSDRW